MNTIGFIGTGVMGEGMAANLLKGGHTLLIHTRTAEKAKSLLENGAAWAPTPADMARRADVVFTMVGYPKDVEEVYLEGSGLLENARPGSILCDCTTSSPALAQRLAREAVRKNVAVLDTPVSGGDVGARGGTLSIMCGGNEEAFESIGPLLNRMGTNIVYHGPAGAGQHAKMANQIAAASGMTAVCEALIYAENCGLDKEKVLQSISSGAAGSWALTNLAPRILRDDFEAGFFVEHFIKDMEIALAECERRDFELPGLRLARRLYQEVVELGMERKGTQALYERYRRNS